MAVKFEQTGEGTYSLDVRGYSCPHPQMYTKKALEKLQTGDVLTLLFDNPSSGESILAMCESSGNDLVDRNDASGVFTWKIQKA